MYSLAQNQEPGAIAMDDEDDVGLSTSNNNSSAKDHRKIQEMLAQYMAECWNSFSA